METQDKPSLIRRLKTLFIGGARSLSDRSLFHKLSLIAFFAWIGLGADGLSSSCYGPEEAFLTLGQHYYLGLFVALGTALTIFVISTSYSQIIELFPTGGGGYVVASKLLSPTVGMISGCALLVDYLLTITLSVASGADALFSFLPPEWYPYRLVFAAAGVVTLTILNSRGVKESVVPLVPIFLTFLITHLFAIAYALITHLSNFPEVATAITADVHKTSAELGFVGMIFLILRSYSMGAGTYTGIEAVSNGIPILREPRVQTAKRTMRYMAVSLAFMALGIMVSYLLYRVEPQFGKTLNAIFLESATKNWAGISGKIFVLVTLVSEAALLFVAAQTGFLDGPRVLANMALDRWVPTKFSSLSDRLVTQNGILIMGGSSLALMLLTNGSVKFLVVLYAINVFITFSLSQLGMVRHWWDSRSTVKQWRSKLLVNGIGLVLTVFILVSVTVLKFHQGGWITLFITGALVGMVSLVKGHYKKTGRLLRKLDSLVQAADSSSINLIPKAKQELESPQKLDPEAKAAVVLVSGFNGLGLHTLLSVLKMFKDTFKNFVFVQIGVLDAGFFKGSSEVERLQTHADSELKRYVSLMKQSGYYAESFSAIGVDVVDEVAQLAPKILERFPNAVFFGGQLVFPKEPIFSKWLHNYTIFAVQRRLYYQGIPVFIMPIRL